MGAVPARSIAALLIGAALMILATGLVGTTTALRMRLAGFPAIAIGVTVGAYFAGLTAGAFWAPRFLARVGHIRTFAGLAAAACAATAALPLLLAPAAWIFLRALTGFAMAGLYMTVESWLNDRATAATRGRYLALYMITNQAALAGGQALVPAYSPESVESFVLAALLYALALIPVALTADEEPSPPTLSHFGARAIWQAAPLAAVVAIVSGIFVGVLLGLGPVYARALGHSTGNAAAFMAAIVLGGLISQWPVGRTSDRIGRRPVIIVVSALLTATAVLAGVTASSSFTYLLVSGTVLGALGFTLYPLGLAFAVDVVGPDKSVAVIGTLLLGYGAGAALGPIVGSLVLSQYGPSALAYLIGAGPGGVALYAFCRVLFRPRVEAGEPYIPVTLPQTAPATDLDPRTEG